MAPPGDEQEAVERLDKISGAAHFVRKLLLFGAPDFSLDGILVQAFEELLDAWREIKLVKAKGFGSLKFVSQICRRQQWPKFQVLAMLPFAFLDKTIG